MVVEVSVRLRGISPVIAIIIILAVTVAIAIAVVGWIMGLFGSFGSTEAIQVLPDSIVKCWASDNATVVLHVKNSGSAAAAVYKAVLQGLITFDRPYAYSGGSFTQGDVIVPPGQTGYIIGFTIKAGVSATTLLKYTVTNLTNSGILPSGATILGALLNSTKAIGTCTPGATYTLKLYTRAGNVYTSIVQATS